MVPPEVFWGPLCFFSMVGVFFFLSLLFDVIAPVFLKESNWLTFPQWTVESKRKLFGLLLWFPPPNPPWRGPLFPLDGPPSGTFFNYFLLPISRRPLFPCEIRSGWRSPHSLTPTSNPIPYSDSDGTLHGSTTSPSADQGYSKFFGFRSHLNFSFRALG